MKKIAIFGTFAIALLACIGFTACNNKSDVVPEEPETYTVHLGWSGEINVSYEPLMRAATNDLYGIQVYSKPTSDSSSEWTPYAYGLFDDPNNVVITLQKGYKYKFESTMIKNGKNRVNTYNGGYSYPFYLSSSPWHCAITNDFDYTINQYFNGANGGAKALTDVVIVVGDGNGYSRANVERFYGILSDYIPSENSSAKIDMKRTSFGAKFIATGKLAVDGKLEMQIEDAPKMELVLTAGDDMISDIFTFAKVDAAWENAEYIETVNVSFNWNRTDGTVRSLGTHPITFKRNTTTVVEVKIENENTNEGLNLNIADDETGVMPTGEKVTITDGEVVDTEVETN